MYVIKKIQEYYDNIWLFTSNIASYLCICLEKCIKRTMQKYANILKRHYLLYIWIKNSYFAKVTAVEFANLLAVIGFNGKFCFCHIHCLYVAAFLKGQQWFFSM